MLNQEQIQQRQTAYRVWIGDILKSNLALDGERFNFVEVAHKKITRVNVIANVIDKYKSDNPDKSYATLTLDDASGQIRVKTFGSDTLRLADINVGNTILVIGQLRYFNNELYVVPEIIKQLDEKWLLVRKLELEEEYGTLSKENIPVEEKPSASSMPKVEKAEGKKEEVGKMIVTEEKFKDEQIEEKEKNEDVKESIFNIIKKNDEGIDVDALIMSVNYPVSEVNVAIASLIEDGRIYEPKPGRLRSI